MLALGDTRPPLRLPDATGRDHDLDETAADRPALVLFLCNHCPYVKHVAGPLAELAKAWEANGVAVIAVNPNARTHPGDTPELMGPFATEHGWTFPYVIDADQAVARAFGAQATPDPFLFDGQNRLVYRGQLDSSRPSNGEPVTGADVDAAIGALLDGRRPSTEQAPTAGCSIKWL